MKSNPRLLPLAVQQGVGVDVASLGEIEQAVALGVNPEDMI